MINLILLFEQLQTVLFAPVSDAPAKGSVFDEQTLQTLLIVQNESF